MGNQIVLRNAKRAFSRSLAGARSTEFVRLHFTYVGKTEPRAERGQRRYSSKVPALVLRSAMEWPWGSLAFLSFLLFLL